MTVQEFVNSIRDKHGLDINPWSIRDWQAKGYIPDLRDGGTNYRNFETFFPEAERKAILLELGFNRESLGNEDKEREWMKNVIRALEELK